MWLYFSISATSFTINAQFMSLMRRDIHRLQKIDII